MADVLVRDASVEDLAEINAIYNHYVVRSTCTYQNEPTTTDERLAWFRNRTTQHPVTVAVEAGVVVGWGALSSFRERIGYRFTVENAVYVRHDHQRRGVGRRLLADLVDRAQALGHRTIIAAISAEQDASIALHQTAGFVAVGRLNAVATKFDQWLDLVLMQRLLR